MSRILIVSHDVVGKRMAAPGIRCWEFANVLSSSHHVTLATPNPSDLESSTFEVTQYDGQTLIDLARESEVVVVSGLTLAFHPALKSLKTPLVVDIYCPFVLENLALFAHEEMGYRHKEHRALLEITNDLLLSGDFFLCGSEEQRSYWLGMLTALNRINPLTYSLDQTLDCLIAIVPYGYPVRRPQHRKQVLKGVHSGIEATDKVILWGGGIYDWLDPLTLIEAMRLINDTRPEVKLFFMGIDHPNPQVRPMKMREQAIRLSKELGLYGRHIFFNSWIPYDERENYLLEADVGVSLQLRTLETRFAFRARLLDYFWACLPIVVNRGDPLSCLVEERKLGTVVDCLDPHRLAEALLTLLENPGKQGFSTSSFAVLDEKWTWPSVTRPLLEFCNHPRMAPDRPLLEGNRGKSPVIDSRDITPWYQLPRKTWGYYRQFGIRGLCREIGSYMQWRLRGRR